MQRSPEARTAVAVVQSSGDDASVALSYNNVEPPKPSIGKVLTIYSISLITLLFFKIGYIFIARYTPIKITLARRAPLYFEFGLRLWQQVMDPGGGPSKKKMLRRRKFNIKKWSKK